MQDAIISQEFSFINSAIKEKIASAVLQAQAMILRLQVRINGKPTIWAQQHDAISELPCGARNFEPPALSSSESANILQYLISIKKPTFEIEQSIHHATNFFQLSALMGVEFVKNSDPSVGGRLLRKEGAGPLWARFIDLKTLKPIFGDRDRSIHDDINDISHERRNRYSWFNTAPNKFLKTLKH